MLHCTADMSPLPAKELPEVTTSSRLFPAEIEQQLQPHGTGKSSFPCRDGHKSLQRLILPHTRFRGFALPAMHSRSKLERDRIHFPCSRGRGRNPSSRPTPWPEQHPRCTEYKKRAQDEGILYHLFHSDQSIFTHSSSSNSIISPFFCRVILK